MHTKEQLITFCNRWADEYKYSLRKGWPDLANSYVVSLEWYCQQAAKPGSHTWTPEDINFLRRCLKEYQRERDGDFLPYFVKRYNSEIVKK